MLQRFADDLRMLAVNERTFWPSENRQAFYVDGTYEARVPVGTYELVATRGPEFKAWRGKLEVKKDKVTKSTVSLERYADLPAKGWYSGDAHIHVTRDEAADPTIWGFVAAEDVYVGNLLEMGNIAALHFKQPKEWGKASRFERDGHFLVSGQEDPRTGHFGHTIHHNLQQPIRPSADEYWLYHKVFEEARSQGGVSGFAHMGWGQREGQEPQMNRALTLLAPSGLVNFIEVLQAGRFMSDGWYRLLNLGYRINPAAGSDWPYSDFPGVVRNFVKARWAAQSGCMVRVLSRRPHVRHEWPVPGVHGERQGHGRGAARQTRHDARARQRDALNPDVDKLDRLELVALGDVIDSKVGRGTRSRRARTRRIVADRSMWIAVRSFGSRQEPAT